MMADKKRGSYKYCIVPMCKNTTLKNPNKTFFHVPINIKKRKLWCKVMKRSIIGPKTACYVCEDHFDVENDTKNFIKYKLVGGKLRLKANITPHKFDCQNSSKSKQLRGGERGRIELCESPSFDCFEISRAKRRLAKNSEATVSQTNDGPKPSTSANNFINISTYVQVLPINPTQEPEIEFLEIKEEVIQENFPSTSNANTEKASKERNIEILYDPLPIKNEVCDEVRTEPCTNNPSQLASDGDLKAPKPVKNNDILSKDLIRVKEEDDDSEEFLISTPKINKPTPSIDKHLIVPVITPKMPLLRIPVNNSAQGMTKELDQVDKFMLEKAIEIKTLRKVDQKITLLNDIDRLVNEYVTRDLLSRRGE